MAALFGRRVKRLRTAAGLTQAELGQRTHIHSTRINQVERTTGHKPTRELAELLDRALGADELLVDLWPYVHRESFPNWSRAFMEREAQAVLMRKYMAHTVPGLLQTEDYARAILRTDGSLSEEQLAERIAARMARQEILSRADSPELRVVLDESVLLRPVGGPDVMRTQLARLLDTENDPRIVLRVLPFSEGEHQSMGGSLTLLNLPDGSEVVYTEGADYGRLIEDPVEVKPYVVNYDRLSAQALPPIMSLDLIRSVMEGDYRASHIPSRSERRRVAQVQLQQRGGRGLRRGGGRRPLPRPRA
ncbi:helix-turn-helix domain-containing protein [Kitasatospora mediocidica]|uniref:helix-turn-helix domain-containing protein n=1 Tax=Kitasatospora mediocidica TaxID=58352 RepID=UPI000562D9CB|nr:helix-turn-helix transcriptional regulator [Kitasatospora mediocidica]